MNAESDKIRDSLVDQLSSFEDRLDNKIDDVKMLSEIQDGIGKLLGSDGANEAEIRRVLQDRYDNGALRKETFQLVKSMLDRYVTEQVPTSSKISAQPARVEPKVTVDLGKDQPTGDDPMSSTQVIPAVELGEPDSADDRIQVVSGSCRQGGVIPFGSNQALSLKDLHELLDGIFIKSYMRQLFDQ